MTNRDHDVNWGAVSGVIVGVLTLIAAIVWLVSWQSSARVETCTVERVDRTVRVVSDGDGNVSSSSDARVYTSECGVLQVADDVLRLHFTSADVFGQISEGATYELDVVGWRVPLLSIFPNVVEAELVELPTL